MRSYWHFLSSSWPLLAFGFTSIFWGNFGQSFFLSWYGTPIQESLELSAGAYGSLYSAATLCSSLMIMIFGGMIDRWPLKRFATLAAAGLTLACLVLAAAVNVWLLFIGFFLVRLFGQGLLPHTAQTTMARCFDSHRGKALSISASGVPAGEIILPIMAVALITWLGWQRSWLVFAVTVPLVYLPLIYWFLCRSNIVVDQYASSQKVSTQSGGRRQMLADYRFWLALPAVLAPPFLLTGIFIQQGFLLAQKAWSPHWFASCFVAFGIAHWLSSMMSGALVDNFSARRLLPLLMLPLAAAMFSVVFFDGSWVALLFMILLGITIGASSPVIGSLWAEVYGTGKLGSIRSLMTSLMMISTAASPILFGVLIDRGISLGTLYGAAGWGVILAGIMIMFSYGHERHDRL